MDASTTERKSCSPGESNRGLELVRRPVRRSPGEDGSLAKGACRRCGCKHFRVVCTRPTWGGPIMRRRECRHCGKRMTTWGSANAH